MHRIPISATVVATVMAVLSSSALANPSAQGLFSSGIKLLENGDPASARKNFTQVRQLAPQWAMGHLYWGIATLAVEPGNPDLLNVFEKVVAMLPDNPRGHYYLARALEQASRFEEAALAYEQAERVRPGMRDSVFRMAGCLQRAGHSERAIAAFKAVISEDPRQIGAIASLAQLYEQQKDWNNAELSLLSIARLNPDVAYHRYQLAQFYERIGDKRKARDNFKRADALDPRKQRKLRDLRPSRK